MAVASPAAILLSSVATVSGMLPSTACHDILVCPGEGAARIAYKYSPPQRGIPDRVFIQCFPDVGESRFQFQRRPQCAATFRARAHSRRIARLARLRHVRDGNEPPLAGI